MHGSYIYIYTIACTDKFNEFQSITKLPATMMVMKTHLYPLKT